MDVLLYQIGIFLAIQIAALFGKSSRNTAIILISIFTILQVFMSWLLLLQFITIYISYNISKNLFFSNRNEKLDDKSHQILKEVKPILKGEELFTYSDENGGRAYMKRKDYEELMRRKEEERQRNYKADNGEDQAFNKMTMEERMDHFIKSMEDQKG